MSGTRVFFCTDTHGSDICFLKFIGAAKFYKADVIVLSGDITGKMVVPIIKQPSGTFRTNYLGVDYLLKNETEEREFETRIKNGGFYPYLTDDAEVKAITADSKKIDELFKRLMLERVERWVRKAEERLKGTGVRCLVSCGNDDLPEVEPVLNSSDYIINPEGKVVSLDQNHEMVTCGYTNFSPWRAPRECTEEELAERIENLASQVQNMKNCIFNLHAPPYQSGLDEAPKLDDQFRPVVSGGSMLMIPVGSTAVRHAIEVHQPLLGLHGHIHEGKGVHKLNRTLCINPGSEYSEGILRGIVLNLDDGKVKSYYFTTG